MTRRAEESEKWIESHEEMTKEMESLREKFEISETQNKNLQSELENAKTRISEMELKIQSLETESATSLKRVTTENESCKSHLNAKILKLSEELEVERRRVRTVVSKLERIALKRLDRAMMSRQRSDCGHALRVWKGKTEQSIRRFHVLERVVMRCVQRKRRDMLRRGFHGLIRGIEIVKAQVYLRDLRREYDEKICRLESTCQKKCSAMRDAHTIALEEARRDAISARSRALKESSREEFRQALRLNRSLQIQEDEEEQTENRKHTNEKISSLREMIVRESSTYRCAIRMTLNLTTFEQHRYIIIVRAKKEEEIDVDEKTKTEKKACQGKQKSRTSRGHHVGIHDNVCKKSRKWRTQE